MSMSECDKAAALMAAEALRAYGITDIFASPGSRDVPLIVSFSRSPELKVWPVIDERSAAFIALGHSLISRRPAALVCTSGSAMLNYAPALAEAFYRKAPLIVFTADRPSEWIDQDDSQTIHQPGAFGNLVKGSFSLRGELSTDLERWEANRVLNDALQLAVSGRPGPVHINISFTEPLTCASAHETCRLFRKIETVTPSPKIDVSTARALAGAAYGQNILIAGGFCGPAEGVNKAMALLSSLPTVVVAADALTNLSPAVEHVNSAIVNNQAILNRPESRPSLLITFGGSMLSKNFKEYLRHAGIREHWHIGANDMLIDSYFSLTKRIEISEENFFPRFAAAIAHLTRVNLGVKRPGRNPLPAGENSLFKSLWHEADFRAAREYSTAVETDATAGKLTSRLAIEKVLTECPKEWNLQLSNGLTPRYAMQSAQASLFHRRDCNRGVSGIDGSVSTALGASLPFRKPTLLITGDMSMQYDLAALSSSLLTDRLKIVVISNGGGGIFRKIAPTRDLPERDRFLVGKLRLPLAKLADAYGLNYFYASTPDQLAALLPDFIGQDEKPALLELKVTD